MKTRRLLTRRYRRKTRNTWMSPLSASCDGARACDRMGGIRRFSLRLRGRRQRRQGGKQRRRLHDRSHRIGVHAVRRGLHRRPSTKPRAPASRRHSKQRFKPGLMTVSCPETPRMRTVDDPVDVLEPSRRMRLDPCMCGARRVRWALAWPPPPIPSRGVRPPSAQRKSTWPPKWRRCSTRAQRRARGSPHKPSFVMTRTGNGTSN